MFPRAVRVKWNLEIHSLHTLECVLCASSIEQACKRKRWNFQSGFEPLRCRSTFLAHTENPFERSGIWCIQMGLSCALKMRTCELFDSLLHSAATLGARGWIWCENIVESLAICYEHFLIKNIASDREAASRRSHHSAHRLNPPEYRMTAAIFHPQI